MIFSPEDLQRGLDQHELDVACKMGRAGGRSLATLQERKPRLLQRSPHVPEGPDATAHWLYQGFSRPHRHTNPDPETLENRLSQALHCGVVAPTRMATATASCGDVSDRRIANAAGTRARCVARPDAVPPLDCGGALTTDTRTTCEGMPPDLAPPHTIGLRTSAPELDDSPAAVAAIGRIDVVPNLLRILCETTGMGFSAVARVTAGTWTACAVQDNIGFGLKPGGQLDIETTLFRESREARVPIVIDHASLDPVYRGHHTPRLYGIESYISVPIILPDGEYFGNLCAIDPQPAKVSDGRIIGMFTGFAELIAVQLASERASEGQRLGPARRARRARAARTIHRDSWP
jgi:hypothetical protein